jgi:hypothetical protein
VRRGHAVDDRRSVVDRAYEARRREVGEADAVRVAARLGRQVAHEEALHGRVELEPPCGFRPTTFVSMPEPLMFFPISSTMSRSGRGREPREPALREHEELLLARLERLGQHGLDERGLLVAVLDEREPARDPAAREEHATRRPHDVVEGVRRDRAVVERGAGVLAEPDERSS